MQSRGNESECVLIKLQMKSKCTFCHVAIGKLFEVELNVISRHELVSKS